MKIKVKLSGHSWVDRKDKIIEVEVVQIKDSSGAYWSAFDGSGYEIEPAEAEPIGAKSALAVSVPRLFGENIKTLTVDWK